MTMTLRAHYDGKAFVPDEPVNVPVGTSVEVQVCVSDAVPQMAACDQTTHDESRRRVLAMAKNLARGIGPRNWVREDLYVRR